MQEKIRQTEDEFEAIRQLILALQDPSNKRRWAYFLRTLRKSISDEEYWQRHLRLSLSFAIKVIEDQIRREEFASAPQLRPPGPLYVCDNLKCELQYGQKSFISADGRGNQS